MKRLFILLLTLTVLIFTLSGCFLKSVHPLITNENAVMVNGLDGIYESSSQRWTFVSDNDPDKIADMFREYPDENVSFEPGETDTLNLNAYMIKIEQLDEPNVTPDIFLGMAGEINGDLFLNLKLLDFDFGLNTNFGALHKFNVNTFSKINVKDEGLIIEPFASSWIGDQILNNRVRIKHEVVRSEFGDSQEILITASTDELRQFVEKYGKEENAYEDPIQLQRVQDEIE